MTINEYNNSTGTVVGQANAEGAMAVGAALYTNTPAFGFNPPTLKLSLHRGKYVEGGKGPAGYSLHRME